MDVEALNTWSRRLDVRTEDLNIDIVKNILTVVRSRIPKETFDKDDAFSARVVQISDALMSHMKCGLPTIEEQSIFSLTYCTLLKLMSEKNAEDTLQIIHVALSSFQQMLYAKNEEFKSPVVNCEYSRKRNIIIIGLINGIFKSDLNCKFEGSTLQKVSDSIVLLSFKIISKMCLLYSNVTFHSFKTLHVMLEKILVWGTVDRVMVSEMDQVIAFVISSNWENSISGVREMNSKLLKTFRQLMVVHKNNILDAVKNVTIKYPWNRAKYLILCEALPNLRDDGIFETLKSIRDGLELSLHCSSLVSAGSSLYKIMISNLTLDKWYERFFKLFTSNMFSEKRCIQTNILNHWLLPSLKCFPDLFDILLDLFVGRSLSDNNHYALLHILKIGRKTGHIFTNWMKVSDKERYFKDLVLSGLLHIDEDVRSQAFQVVCNTHQFAVISEEECEIVKDFLTANVNYNSTSFCNSIINAFTVFFIRLIESLLYLIKNGKLNSNRECLYNEDSFIWIHEFIVQNLQQPGNYHRKIFSLHINEIVLRYLKPTENKTQNTESTMRHTKNGSYRKGPSLGQVSKIEEYFRAKNKCYFQEQTNVRALIKCIFDPANDVRELATNILVGHYREKILQSNHTIEELFVNGLVLCNSRMFYEMESGCLMFKIIANLSECPNLPLDGCSDLLEYLVKKATDQFELQRNDLLLSIYNNKPLYGFISALKMTTQHANDAYSISDVTLQTLLSLSDEITKHYLNILACKCENDTKDYPPSFAEMSDSIEHVISTSEYRYDPEDESNLHISNAHHLVLNNIWLNLDASCGLLSTLLLKYGIRMDTKTIADCLNVFVSVLTRCRHKGAIERAGVTLGTSIRHLTSLKNPEIDELISSMLRNFLVQATSANESRSGSITRKSAGFTILVDKIISNDSREEKPLFYLATGILLNALKSWKISSKLNRAESSPSADDLSNEQDVPLAIALHLLCRTVGNSSLASFVVQFASELTAVCFDHLTSEQWQVRNAALQLYGALVPKLIGQRSSQGEETCPVSPYELFVHVPSLWNHVRNSLQAVHEEKLSKNILESHSNLVPILSLLSSMARRQNYYPFCSSACAQLNIRPVLLEDIFEYVRELLSSPIYAVRNMSAKIIQSFYPLLHFYECLKNKAVYSENELHGYLMAVKYYVLYYNNFSDKYLMFTSESTEWYEFFVFIETKMCELVQNSSYLVKCLYLEVNHLLQKSVNSNYHSLNEYTDSAKDSVRMYNECINSKKNQMGVHQWINLETSIAITSCEESNLLNIIEIFLNVENITLIENVCMPVLKDRLKKNIFSKQLNYKSLFEMIIQSNIIKRVGKNTLRVLYMLALNIPQSEKFCSSKDFHVLISSLNLKNNSRNIYNQGYLLPLLCLIICDSTIDILLKLSNVCRKLAKPEVNDSEHRYIAATSINHLAKAVFATGHAESSHSYQVKVDILMSAMWLLQDESADIRNQCSKISFLRDEFVFQNIHPNIHLKTILSHKFLLSVFNQSPEFVSMFLKTVLSEIPTDDMSNAGADLQNPFDHNTSNTYWEPELMKENIILMLTFKNCK